MIPNFSQARILVLGDLMLDRYWSGSTSRISPEAPVPVVHVSAAEERPGGAANVALNAAALGAQVFCMGIVGEDPEAEILEGRLQGVGITTDFFRTAQVPTITKLRIVSQQQQLIRLDFESSLRDVHLSDAYIKNFEHYLDNSNVLILSDYAKGTLSEIQYFIQLARRKRVVTLVDPKGVDFDRYRGATLLTPNLREFEAVVGLCETESMLVEKGMRLLQELELGGLLITRGERGMTLLRHGIPDELHLPAMAREVYDVSGAGDTVIATLASALGAGAEFPEAVRLANLAAGIVVGRFGTAAVSRLDLQQQDHTHHQPMSSGVLNEEQLLLILQKVRESGEKIVLTNGCFDILHAGHVSYLAQAKQLGQRLIVLVNDDDSVKRLKGKNRPINTLVRRMAVLAGLESVDWVLPFTEDTPLRLIQRIMPDVLVKGGDYEVSDVVGAQDVLAKGGRVEIIPLVLGCSTSRIVEQIQEQESTA